MGSSSPFNLTPDQLKQLRAAIKGAFPALRDSFEVTSDRTPSYNCIAWAASDNSKWWWPDPWYQKYWPHGVPRTDDEESFVSAFELLGYLRCSTSSIEDAVEKVAIYSIDGKATHMARQLANGKWTSKLGDSQDIMHDSPAELEGQIYGKVRIILSRRTSQAPSN